MGKTIAVFLAQAEIIPRDIVRKRNYLRMDHLSIYVL